VDDAELDAIRARRWRLFATTLMLLVVAGGLALALGAFGGDGKKGTASANGVRGAKEVSALLRGVPQGGLVLGRPDAPATITVFADLHCPHCRDAFTGGDFREVVDRVVRPGKANLRLALIALPGFGENSAQGRVAVTGLAPRDRAWTTALMLWFNQGAPGGPWIGDGLLRRIAEVGPGLRGVPLRMAPTVDGRRIADETDALRDRLDVDGTPAWFVRARGSSDEREIDVNRLGGSAGAIESAVRDATGG
jgi:hypothetical protein